MSLGKVKVNCSRRVRIPGFWSTHRNGSASRGINHSNLNICVLVHTVLVHTDKCLGLKILFLHIKARQNIRKICIWWLTWYPKEMFWKVINVFWLLERFFLRVRCLYGREKETGFLIFFQTICSCILNTLIEFGFSKSH